MILHIGGGRGKRISDGYLLLRDIKVVRVSERDREH